LAAKARKSSILAWLLVAAGVAACAWLVFGGEKSSSAPRLLAASPRANVVKHRRPLHLFVHRTGSLTDPVQDASAVALDRSRAMLLGGLTASDTSTDAVRVVSATGSRPAGSLTMPVHDSAAAHLGGSVYLFGGGDGVQQFDEIVRIGRGGGAVGRLPAPSSDQAAATIGGTAYIVGGYTGTKWLDTIVAWRPGGRSRIVARLPSPVRYAAVTALGGTLVVAGGSLPGGGASDAVLGYTPSTGQLTRIGRLPAPTTHAAAAALGDMAYVIGGRTATVGTPTARLVAIDIGSGRVRPAGRLPAPLSDAAATTLGHSIVVVGGKSVRRTEGSLLELATGRPAIQNVYAADGANMLRRAVRAALPRVYVPNSDSNTVDVIDPRTYKIVEHFVVSALPQHVTPAYDLKTLYVTNDLGNSLTPIDPNTGKPGRPIPVDDPYNMYFTPDGRYAIIVAERLHRLDFRGAHDLRLHKSLNVPCIGIDHMDFSADGTYLIASCEFSGQMIKVDVKSERVVGVLDLPDGRAGMPQDVKLSPDGTVFYVADMHANGLWEINGTRLKVIGFLRTGAGVHGLYPSRNGKLLYATNRGEGSISVISFRTRTVLRKWRIPGGGSPDMGGVSADGKTLWLSGRYNGVVYAISTRTGRLLAKIPVGQGPHGLCVWPQPGRYSLGHTGILR
jgi:YVTN family beta-propeller protein